LRHMKQFEMQLSLFDVFSFVILNCDVG
jgi:hypothetical protein